MSPSSPQTGHYSAGLDSSTVEFGQTDGDREDVGLRLGKPDACIDVDELCELLSEGIEFRSEPGLLLG